MNPLSRIAGALKHAWDSYHAWRIQAATIACLRRSDQQLEDIGLTRAQIDCAVRGTLDSHPHIGRDCGARAARSEPYFPRDPQP